MDASGAKYTANTYPRKFGEAVAAIVAKLMEARAELTIRSYFTAQATLGRTNGLELGIKKHNGLFVKLGCQIKT